MSATEVDSATPETSVPRVNMNLEIQIIPVSDVDRSKAFYQRLGWRLDDDLQAQFPYLGVPNPPP